MTNSHLVPSIYWPRNALIETETPPNTQDVFPGFTAVSAGEQNALVSPAKPRIEELLQRHVGH